MSVWLSLSIAQNSQSIENNTSNVTTTLKAHWNTQSYDWNGAPGWLQIDGTKYTFDVDLNPNKTSSGSQTLLTKTVDVTHNSDGTKTLTCSASYTTGTASGTITASASKVLDTIPRKSSLSVSNGTLGTAQTLTVTKQASAFTHTITYKCGSASGTICTKSSSTSISWTPPASLASQNTTGKSVSATFTITTYNGDTNIGSTTTAAKTFTIPSTAAFSPKCTVKIEEYTNYAATYGAPIKGFSKLQVTVIPTRAYDSPISSYSTTVNGTKYTSESFITEVITSSGTITASSTVKDNRGNSGTDSATINVMDYAPPAIDRFTVHRCDADGTANDKGDHVKVLISYHVASLNAKNACGAYIQYKKTGESNYCDPIDLLLNDVFTVVDREFIFEADTGSSYDVLLSVSDNLRTTTTTTSASTAFTLMHWKDDGTGMAIGKISEESDLFDVDLASRFLGPVYGNVMGLNRLPAIPANSNLNDYMTTGSYAIYSNANAEACTNVPVPMAGRLEVSAATGEGIRETEWSYLRQRYIPYDLRYPEFQRDISRSTDNVWVYDEWVVTGLNGQRVLWEGTKSMTNEHSISLNDSILTQPTGIVLIFSKYTNGAAEENNFNHFFVPKKFVAIKGGYGNAFTMMDTNFGKICHKYLYINPTTISGHANNESSGTGASGIAYNNAAYVLRYVIGV